MLGRFAEVTVEQAATVDAAVESIRRASPDVMLLDVHLEPSREDRGGLEVLRQARTMGCKAKAVVVTGDLRSVRDALRAGASDYVLKDELSIDVLRAILDELRSRSQHPAPLRTRREGHEPTGLGALLGDSDAMSQLRARIARTAEASAPVLIRGETGTGKELVARALHETGRHADQPFVAINCSSIPPQLFESVLFGHERGAFTGADRRVRGQLPLAGHGTVLLDEVAEMPLEIQARLLRVLEVRTILPVGAERELPFTARVLAATHVDLEGRVEDGLFRRDLYYRLNVLRIDVPPLVERTEDIPLLAAVFGNRAERSITFSPGAVSWLMAHPWPGNVRELKNLVDRVALLSTELDITAATLEAFAGSPSGTFAVGDIQRIATRVHALPGALGNKLDAIERAVLAETLRGTSYNKSEAARLLGMDRKALERRLHRLGIVEESDPKKPRQG